MKVGYLRENIYETYKDWVEIFNNLVGKNGTIVIPAFTNSFFRYGKKKDIIFNLDSAPNGGALVRAFHKFGNPERSHHPTNSCFAIGPEAKFILNGHDANSSCYTPYGKVIRLNGKNLMLGTLDTCNAPMSFHYAQEVLGHTKKHPLSGLLQAYYIDKDGQKKLYTRYDIGGCTSGAFKSLSHHLIDKAMVIGKVGLSLSAVIDTSFFINN